MYVCVVLVHSWSGREGRWSGLWLVRFRGRGKGEGGRGKGEGGRGKGGERE